MLLWTLLLASQALSPGLWETRNEPGKATLNARVLDDLPIGEISTDRICLKPADAADPGKWLGRDLAGDCRLDPARIATGTISISGTCRATAERGAGQVALTGRYEPASYELQFVTAIDTPQGTMTFSGRMTGRRVGDCAANGREGKR